MILADGNPWLPAEQTRNPIDQAILTAAPFFHNRAGC
jgi:hypothetical protein